jgi:hypothetical protein
MGYTAYTVPPRAGFEIHRAELKSSKEKGLKCMARAQPHTGFRVSPPPFFKKIKIKIKNEFY